MKITSSANSDDYKYFFIAIFPILSLYDFLPMLNLGYIILVLIIILKLVKKKLIVTINPELFLVMAILILINLLVGVVKYSVISNTINNTASMIVFTVLAVFFCCPGYIEPEKLYRACKVIAIVATAFLIYQVIMYTALDIVIKGNIPLLPYSESGFDSIEYGRPTSFFYEPAHYIIYIAPIYAISLIKRDYMVSFIIAIGVVVSTSTTGIILLIIVPIIISFKKSKVSIITIVIAIITIATVSSLPVNYDRYLSKLDVNSLMVNVRAFGTLSYFQYFSMTDLFFGIGLNRLAELLYDNGVLNGKNYASSLIFLVFSFGILGSLFWTYLCIQMYKNTNSEYKVMWFILMFILLSDQIFANRNLLYLLIWVYAFRCHKEPNRSPATINT